MQFSQTNHNAETPNEKLSLLQLLDPGVLADPYPFYRVLREHDPVRWDPYMHAWVVTSYDEVSAVLTYYSADRAPAADYLDRLGLSFMKPFAEMMRQQMLFRDGTMHARSQHLLSGIHASQSTRRCVR